MTSRPITDEEKDLLLPYYRVRYRKNKKDFIIFAVIAVIMTVCVLAETTYYDGFMLFLLTVVVCLFLPAAFVFRTKTIIEYILSKKAHICTAAVLEKNARAGRGGITYTVKVKLPFEEYKKPKIIHVYEDIYNVFKDKGFCNVLYFPQNFLLYKHFEVFDLGLEKLRKDLE